MTIYSWNMYYRNAKQDRAFAFIQEADFDLLCLQEVPEEFLERLKTLSCEIAYGAEVDRLFPSGVSRNYSVILSKYRIVSRHAFTLPIAPQKFRTRAFLQLMRIMRWSPVDNHGGISAIIETPEFAHGLEVFSVHMLLTNPTDRATEFGHILAQRNQHVPTIICGDFNLIDSPKLSILNWLLGGTIADAFFWNREREKAETVFAANDLQNPLRGQITHPFSRSQLDHILVSKPLNTDEARVSVERPGSDHSPISIEISA